MDGDGLDEVAITDNELELDLFRLYLGGTIAARGYGEEDVADLVLEAVDNLDECCLWGVGGRRGC